MSRKETLVNELRMVLIGKVGVGKTSVMNTILRSQGNEKPSESCLHTSSTEKCDKKTKTVGKQKVVVVDTPGLPKKKNEKVMKEVERCVSLAPSGLHAFLFVLQFDRFTPVELEMVEKFKKTFSKEVFNYTMVLFAGNKDQDVEDFIKDSKDLKDFVEKCKMGYHVIDIDDEDPSQVTELLEKISQFQENGEKLFTSKMTRNSPAKKIAAAVSTSALAGAGVGGAASHFGGIAAITLGIGAGAIVGGVLGAVGIVTLQHIKTKCKARSQE